MASLTDLRNRLNGRGRVPQVATTAPSSLDVASGTYTPLLPTVNLLPAVFAQRQANRGLVRTFVWAGIAVILLMGVAFGARYVVQFFQQAELTELQRNAATYTQTVSDLSKYQTYKEGIATERSTMANVLQNDLKMDQILTILNRQANDHRVRYNNISLTVGSGGSCISDPFGAAPTVGCITLSGTAPSQSDASRLFSDLNSDSSKGFLNGVPSSLTAAGGAAGGAGGYTFNGSVSFNQAFYSTKSRDLSSDLNSLIGGSSTTTTNSTAVLQNLQNGTNKALFTNTTASQATSFANQVCAATTAGVSSTNLTSSVVNAGQAISVNIPSNQALQIASTVVGAQCPNQISYIPGGNA